MNHLNSILSNYINPTSIIKITPLTDGNINNTYLVEYSVQRLIRKAVLQQLNKNIFHSAEDVINNFLTLTDHISSKTSDKLYKDKSNSIIKIPELYTTNDHKPFVVDESGFYWRLYSYIESSEMIDVVLDPQHAFSLGRSLSEFHILTRDLPFSSFSVMDNLRNFHILPFFIRQYRKAYAENISKHICNNELYNRLLKLNSTVDLYAVNSSIIEQAKLSNKLSIAVIHGDPKVSNFLYNSTNNKVLAIVDFDTLMHAPLIYDLGDLLRSCTNPEGEEPENALSSHFDLSLFSSALRGYLSTSNPTLTKSDICLIPYSVKLIAFELGIRFLSDFLCGNKYFKCSSKYQNLHRAEVQFNFVNSLELQWSKIITEISTLTAK